MAYMVCDRFHIGPFCSDKRLERTPAEKVDCVVKAQMECISDVWQCRREIIAEQLSGRFLWNPDNNSDYLKEPLDDLQCYKTTCLDPLLACWCAGMGGLTCTVCEDNPPSGSGLFPDDEEEEEEPEEEPEDPGSVGGGGTVPRMNTHRVTFSDTDLEIPVVFGKVLLTGNIINITEPTDGVVDFDLGLAEGEVDDILRVWIGGTLVIDFTSSSPTISAAAEELGLKITLRKGSESQHAPPVSNFSKVVAYRGLSYARVEGYPLAGTQGRMPDVRVEVTTRAERGVSTYATSATAADDDSLFFEQASGRILYSAGATLGILRAPSMSSVYSTTAHASIVPGTVTVTPDDNDILFQTVDKRMYFISAIDRSDRLTYNASLDYNTLAGYRIPSQSLGEIRFVAGISGNAIHTFYSTQETFALSAGFSYTEPLVSAFSSLSCGYFAPGTVNEELCLYAIGQSADKSLLFCRQVLHSAAGAVDFDGSLDMERQAIYPADLSLVAPTLLKVLTVFDESCFLLFLSSDGRDYCAKIAHGDVLSVEWVREVSASPSGRFTPILRGTTLQYPAGDFVYNLDLSDGSSEVSYQFSATGAPVLGSGSSYDTRAGVLYYVTGTGFVAKVLPGRLAAGTVTLEEAVGALLDRVGVPSQHQIVSDLSAIVLDGYRVDVQRNASACLEELGIFYHLSTRESSDGIVVSPVALSDSMTIDDATYASSTKTARENTNKDKTTFVRIGYFDSEKEYAIAEQLVSEDMIRDGEGVLGGGFTYSINLYTTPTTVRRSAEMTLLKSLRHSIGTELTLPPRYLGAEPGDFVTTGDGVFRVTSETLDTSMSVRLSATSDDISLYAETPALNGVSYNPLVSSMLVSQPTDNYVILVALPPAVEGESRERVYAGVINPDAATVESSTRYIEAPSSSARRLTTTQTTPVLLGRRTGGLSIPITAHFTTDYTNTLEITFSRNVSASDFSAATAVQLYESLTRNLLLVGRELIQFQSFSIAGDNKTVTFSGLLRGRAGSDFFIDGHVLNETCYVFNAGLEMIELPDEAVSFRQAKLRLVDSVDGKTTRSKRVGYTTVKYPNWGGTYPVATKRWGALANPGMDLFVFARRGFYSAIYNTTAESPGLGEQIIPFDDPGFVYYILKAPFDRATFLAALEEAEAEGDTLESTTSTNSYIHRKLNGGYMNGTVYVSGPATGSYIAVTYPQPLIVSDGFTEDSEFHVAVTRGVNERAFGFKIESGVNDGFNNPTRTLTD